MNTNLEHTQKWETQTKLLETLVVHQPTTIRNPTLLEVVIVEPIDARNLVNMHSHTHENLLLLLNPGLELEHK
jgi:hypothetical protein